MSRRITGATMVAGVVGSPIRHSMSPILHNAWLEAAGLDGVYVPFCPPKDGFRKFAEGLRGGAVRGLNVTTPFKEEALRIADRLSPRAEAAGAANLLTFNDEGEIRADNTDGLGMLAAFEAQAPAFEPDGACVVVLGAGGGSRGAVSAFLLAGAAEVRIVNRTLDRARAIADALGRSVKCFAWDDAAEAMDGAQALVNATSLGLEGGPDLDVDLTPLPPGAPVMDMVYRPLETALLRQARAQSRPAVDGLEMLIGQARPSYRAFYGEDPPPLDVRSLAIKALDL